jgi:6-phosphogluconolactonase (cycloisomerase 2 family)
VSWDSSARAKEPETVFTRASLLILTLVAAVGFSSCGESKHQFAYVTTPFNNGVAAFRLNTTTGALAEVLGSPYPTGISPTAIRVHPSGKFVYVTNAGENTISLYKVGSTGALTEITPRTTTGRQPADLVMDPSGNFLFVTNSADNTVSAYSITAGTGVLEVIDASPFQTAGFTPLRGAVTPSGKFLYVANSNSASVSGFAIDSSGGLAPVPRSPNAVGNGPNWVAVDPAGKFLYVANLEDGTLSGFTIDASTGELTAMSGSPFGVANTITTTVPVTSAMVEASGKYLYVTTLASGNNVYGYNIDGTTGVPTSAISGSPFAAGDKAVFVVSDSTGDLLFVGNQSSSSVSGFKIDKATGALTLVSTTSTGSAPTSMFLIK